MDDTKQYDIVVVSGGFDPVHKGHVRMFKAAKALGHKVIQISGFSGSALIALGSSWICLSVDMSLIILM